MIKTEFGNILSVTSGYILHQVNCQGVMGSGVAKAIKDKYYFVYTEYLEFCNINKNNLLGNVQVVQVTKDLYVVNVFGQLYYGRNPSIVYTNYTAVREALHKLSTELPKTICDIHFPLIGCGLANGDWGKVSDIIEETLGSHNLTLWKFE